MYLNTHDKSMKILSFKFKNKLAWPTNRVRKLVDTNSFIKLWKIDE